MRAGWTLLGVAALCGCSHDWDPFDPRGGLGSAVAGASASSSTTGPGGGSSSTSTASSGSGGEAGAGAAGGGGTGGATGGGGAGGSAGNATGGGGAGGSGGAAGGCGPGSTADATDDFDDGAFAAIWNVLPDPPVTVEEKGGHAVFTIPAVPMNSTFARYTSADHYDMTDCHALVQVVQMASPATLGYGSLAILLGAADYAEIIASGGELELKSIVNDVTTTLDAFPYDPAVHAWWRIRGENGTLYWETSSDGTSWTLHVSSAAPFSLAALHVVLSAGTYQPEPLAPGEVHFDNFNLPP